MYAVIETGGKQYRVQEGDTIFVEKLEGDQGSDIEIDKVLLISSDEGLEVGEPFLEKAKVKASVLEQGKNKKIIVFRYKSKKDYRKKRGHRQPYTKLKIEKITN